MIFILWSFEPPKLSSKILILNLFEVRMSKSLKKITSPSCFHRICQASLVAGRVAPVDWSAARFRCNVSRGAMCKGCGFKSAQTRAIVKLDFRERPRRAYPKRIYRSDFAQLSAYSLFSLNLSILYLFLIILIYFYYMYITHYTRYLFLCFIYNVYH